MKIPIIAMTMGDPGGIGPEVIIKTLRRRPVSKASISLLIGHPAPFQKLKKNGLIFPFHFVRKWTELKPGVVNFWPIAENLSGFDSGRISKRNAIQAFSALRFAAESAAQGRIQAIVTGPLNKTSIRLIRPDFHGHTEYLAKTSGRKHFAMMFVSPSLKVTLVTIHVPLSRVNRLIKKETVLEKIRLTDSFLRKQFKIKRPKLAVCALNPHGQETGPEDEKHIRPAVTSARKKGIEAVGPLSADQVFHEAYEGRYDAVISMYHDQGLAPFKMIAFREGVNVTLGLPYVRTSPDHGTAFDIAYQNKAQSVSFESSLKLAEKLILST